MDDLSGLRMDPSGIRLRTPALPCVVSGRDHPPLTVELASERAGIVSGKDDHSRPLVRVHPVTGRKCIWVTVKNMEYILVGGMALGVEASRDTLAELLSYGLATSDTENVYMYEHHWKAVSKYNMTLCINSCVL